jgi:hypothetical protein
MGNRNSQDDHLTVSCAFDAKVQLDAIAAHRQGFERPLKGLSRRKLLKSLASTAVVALSPSRGRARENAQRGTAERQPAANSPSPAKNPAWYPFNLLEYFSTDPDWMKYFPYKNDGMFLESDFRWMRDWGFNFARLPMDYRFWTDPADPLNIREQKVEPIDRAIGLGEKYGVHVSICLHRAPGACILDGIDAALTGIHITSEKTDLYKDPSTLGAFERQWTFFAQRYKGISCERLSFDLLNEPVVQLTRAERANLKASLRDQSAAAVEREIERRGEKEYARVTRDGR